jgi:hypothetical protein
MRGRFSPFAAPDSDRRGESKTGPAFSPGAASFATQRVRICTFYVAVPNRRRGFNP